MSKGVARNAQQPTQPPRTSTHLMRSTWLAIVPYVYMSSCRKPPPPPPPPPLLLSTPEYLVARRRPCRATSALPRHEPQPTTWVCDAWMKMQDTHQPTPTPLSAFTRFSARLHPNSATFCVGERRARSLFSLSLSPNPNPSFRPSQNSQMRIFSHTCAA